MNVRVRFTGRVQGVGFRYTVHQICDGLGLVGWVCNLSDGTVEAEIRGPKKHVTSALDNIRAQRMAFIEETAVTTIEDDSSITGFKIRY